MGYKLFDTQLGHYSADGHIFRDKSEVRDHLIDFHSIDWYETETRDINSMSLADLLSYGWELDKITIDN
jgi:hypothetical protein